LVATQPRNTTAKTNRSLFPRSIARSGATERAPSTSTTIFNGTPRLHDQNRYARQIEPAKQKRDDRDVRTSNPDGGKEIHPDSRVVHGAVGRVRWICDQRISAVVHRLDTRRNTIEVQKCGTIAGTPNSRHVDTQSPENATEKYKAVPAIKIRAPRFVSRESLGSFTEEIPLP